MEDELPENNDKDLEIIIEDLDPTNPDGDKPPVVDKTDEKPTTPTPDVAKTDDNVDEGLRKLQEQLAAERQGRADAERRANEAARDAHKFRSEAQDSNLHLVTNAIKALEQHNEVLKTNYAAALENQDYRAVADLQMEMSSNAAKLNQLENGRQALESAPKHEEPKPYVSNKVEALAAQLGPRSAAWVRAHPEYAEDPVKYNKMIAAHQFVIADGTVQADTDDYFGAIENVLGIKAASPAPADPAPAQQRNAAPPAAPVSRGGAAPGATPTRIRLSAEEREMAEMMGQTPEEYGRNKLALIREGKLRA